MKRDLSLWQLSGFALTSLAGTLLHFLYDWTRQSIGSALISAVNESTWEHIKLLYVPLFLFAVAQSFFFPEYKNFWCVKLIGTLFGLTLIPVLFYTYNGAIGPSPDWLNIAIFFIAAAAALLLEWLLFRAARPRRCLPRLCLGILIGMGILFIVFTFWPPRLPLFQDPLDGSFGA
ncbi:MAG: hypothetical protein J6R33_01670 [Clostridia bacterium]|nr:hypothetical protein [Clostridia bacterium]